MLFPVYCLTVFFSFLGRIADSQYVVRRCGLLLQTKYRGLSIGRSVCLSVCLSQSWALQRKDGWTNRDTVWVVESGGPKESCIRWGQRCNKCWKINLKTFINAFFSIKN